MCHRQIPQSQSLLLYFARSELYCKTNFPLHLPVLWVAQQSEKHARDECVPSAHGAMPGFELATWSLRANFHRAFPAATPP